MLTGTAFGQNLAPRWVIDGAYISGSNRSIHKPADNVRELKYELDSLPKSIELNVDRVAKVNRRVTLTMIDRGNIVYSYRRAEVSSSSFIVSYSMAKSITSIMVGYALCEGHINNLDERVDSYVPELSGTAFGSSSIKNILNMASGANASGKNGEPYNRFTPQLREQKTSYMENLIKFGSQKKRLLSQIQPGEIYDYKNLDTATLSLLIEKATNMPFHEWYEKTIINNVGMANFSGWTLDRDGRALAHALFFASPDDWIRIAIHSLDLYKGKGGECMQEFMFKAVHDRVKIYDDRIFTQYGYQMWTGGVGMNDNVYWKLGFGGQKIGIDPETEKIIVVSSTEWDAQIFSFFSSWIESR